MNDGDVWLSWLVIFSSWVLCAFYDDRVTVWDLFRRYSEKFTISAMFKSLNWHFCIICEKNNWKSLQKRLDKKALFFVFIYIFVFIGIFVIKLKFSSELLVE